MAYTSQEELEIEELKSWWQENYKVIIAAIIIGLGGASGWHYWQAHQITKNQQLAAQYEQIVYDYQQDPAQKEAQFTQFVKDNEKSSYAVFALLDQAKIAVEAQNFPLAETALKQATAQANDDILLSISALRLATVQYQQQQFDAALASLKLIKDSALNFRKDLLNGDILLAKGDKTGAKASYQQAQAVATPQEQQWVQVRLNNL